MNWLKNLRWFNQDSIDESGRIGALEVCLHTNVGSERNRPHMSILSRHDQAETMQTNQSSASQTKLYLPALFQSGIKYCSSRVDAEYCELEQSKQALEDAQGRSKPPLTSQIESETSQVNEFPISLPVDPVLSFSSLGIVDKNLIQRSIASIEDAAPRPGGIKPNGR